MFVIVRPEIFDILSDWENRNCTYSEFDRTHIILSVKYSLGGAEVGFGGRSRCTTPGPRTRTFLPACSPSSTDVNVVAKLNSGRLVMLHSRPLTPA